MIGDQLVQARGRDGLVEEITETNGFDRTVSVAQSDSMTIRDIVSVDNLDGAVVGMSTASNGTVEDVYGYNTGNVISVSNDTENMDIRRVTGEEIPHTTIDVRDGSTNIRISEVTSKSIETEQRIGIQVNDGAGNVYFEDIDLRIDTGGWLIDVTNGLHGEISFRDVTLTSGSGTINRAIRDGHGAIYDSLSLEVDDVGQGSSIYLRNSSDGATFHDLNYDGGVREDGLNIDINRI